MTTTGKMPKRGTLQASVFDHIRGYTLIIRRALPELSTLSGRVQPCVPYSSQSPFFGRRLSDEDAAANTLYAVGI